MKIKRIITATSIVTVAVTTLFLLANLLSHPECGTSGIDYMPCGYWPRVVWSIQNGFWIPCVILFVFVLGVYILFQMLSGKGQSGG